jgi:6-phosphogluconolactonase
MFRMTWIVSIVLGTMILDSALAANYIVYTGTYTRGNSKGIYAFRFDSATGAIEPMGLMAATPSPSFLAVHPNGRSLYAVNENGAGTPTSGLVTSFSIDAKTGALKELNGVPSGGTVPAHLVVDKTGKTLIVANYGSGSVAALPIKTDGSLGDNPSSLMQHKGSSVTLPRQAGPHAHAVVLSSDNKFVFAPDLGLDQVLSYRLDAAKSALAPNDPPFATVPPGGGPRHMAFHPKGKFAYVNSEITSKVTAFAYDSAHGSLKELQTISTLPQDFKGQSATAEIAVDAKGRFVYVSNRGHDSIAVFAIGGDGKLTPVEHVLTQGKTPRNFQIDPTGAYLFAANQDSDSVVQFRIDPKSGKLTPTGKKLELPVPVCLLFIRAAQK